MDGLRIIGLQLQRLLVIGDGFGKALLLLQRESQAVVEFCRLGLETNRLDEKVNGIVKAALLLIHQAEVVTPVGGVCANPKGPAQAFDRFFQPAEMAERVAEVVVRVQKIWIKFKGAP